jgi:hypothetical protein
MSRADPSNDADLKPGHPPPNARIYAAPKFQRRVNVSTVTVTLAPDASVS